MDDRFTTKDPRLGRRQVWGAVLIVAVLSAVLWVTVGAIHQADTSPPAGAGPGADTSRTEDSAGLTSNTASGATHLERCREVYDAQLHPLLAAGTAMPQWQIHIAAMNKLVLGVITLQQANQFWNRTRVGARHHLHSFATAVARFDRRTVHCLPVGTAPGQRLQQCALAVVARNHVLRIARRALGTWSIHVDHMEMLRDGTMSPARATSLWLQSWRQGQQEVDRYRAAIRDVRADPAPC